jgi:hypothetical protein
MVSDAGGIKRGVVSVEGIFIRRSSTVSIGDPFLIIFSCKYTVAALHVIQPFRV